MTWEDAKRLPVTLPDAERMSADLMRVSPDWRLRATLYPRLLAHAGKSMSAEEMAFTFIQEVIFYTRGTDDLVGSAVKWIFRLLDDDAAAAAAASVYVRYSLASDDTIIQEFEDQTVTRFLDDIKTGDDVDT